MAAEAIRAQEALKRAINALCEKESGELYGNLYEFVLRKFLLFDMDCNETNLLKLSALSTRHILGMTGGSYTLSDTSPSCTGASSAATKKILLLHAIQEAFGVKLEPERTADIETVEMLVEELTRLCGV
jgi:hypothetical protein